LVLNEPTIRNDSIVGTTQSGIHGLAAIDAGPVEVRHFSAIRTLVLGVVVVPVALFTIVLAACASDPDACFP
jgi:hypothetical protein